MMEIDVTKIIHRHRNEFECVDALTKATDDIIQALHIMQSTIENFNDPDSLILNKERMVKYFNKFSKDEVLSKR